METHRLEFGGEKGLTSPVTIPRTTCANFGPNGDGSRIDPRDGPGCSGFGESRGAGPEWAENRSGWFVGSQKLPMQVETVSLGHSVCRKAHTTRLSGSEKRACRVHRLEFGGPSSLHRLKQVY